MKRVYCTHHNQFGWCTEQDWNDTVNGHNPSSMVRVKFESFTQAVPINTLELANWYVCTKYGTSWMGLMQDMIEGYQYPEKDTHTNLTKEEADKIMSTLTYHLHSYSH